MSRYGPSKRTLEAVEEYENLNDEAPVVKRPKLDEGLLCRHNRLIKMTDPYLVEHAGTPSLTGRPTRGNGERINNKQATKETVKRNRTAAVGGQTAPQPAKHQPTDGTENSLYSPSTWNNEYRRRMIACNAKAKKADDKDGTPRAAHQIISTQALFEDDVFLPIAAVWYALVKQDTKVAFGTQRLFELARYNPDHGMCYVLSPRILIMPLIFCAELPDLVGETFEHSNSPSTNTIGKNKKQKKQKANLKTKSSPKAVSTSTKGSDLLLSEQPRIFSHCVLVTAEKIISFNYKESVRLTFMNSQQNPENYDQYRQAARNVVRNSQWLNGSPVWNDESWPMVAQQGSGSLTPAVSGIHVVLNAWAYILNIPLAHNPQLKKDFYAEARKLIQLALKGCLDSGTIRAFMQAYEYATCDDSVCVEQRESNIQKAADGLRHMQTVYMNEPIFNEIIEKIQRNEQGQSTKESDSSSPSGKRGPRNPPVGNPLVPGRDSTTPGKDPPAPPQDPPAPGGGPSASEEDPSGPREDSSGSGGDSPGSGGDPSASGGDSPASPASWEAILDAGIERHTEHFVQQSAEFQSNCTHIESPNNMMDEAVVLAIASFWDGLRRTGTIFGFGTADTFRCNRSEDTVVQGLTAVSGPHPLIIPLLMNEADIHTPPPPKSAKGGTRGKKTAVPKGKGRETDKTSLHHGGIGHFVLAIAERRNNDIVEITVKDSRSGSIRRGELFNAARGFVTHSGWMGIGPQGNPMPANPIFTSEHYPKVPIQRYGNTCGLYAILNAWAYMLNIPIREARVFDATHNHHKFHATALRLINLALAGFMDSSSIQAFFNVWNYAVQQDVNDLSVHVVRADAQRMDPRILQDRIMELRDLDQALALEPPPTEAQITQVTDLGTSREIAIRQLKLATNNAQKVAANLTAARSSPGPAGFSKPRDEDIAFLVEVTGFAPERVSAELTRARGDRNKAINNILDRYKTGNSPTGSRGGSTPYKAGNQTAPPDTGLEHSYDEVDIGRLMSYRDISLNTVLRQLDRAGGDVGKAEERIRHLSNALSSNSGSSQSHHSAANNYGPFDPKLERPHTDADIDEIMAIKHQVQEQVSEERENFAGNVERSRRDMIKGLTQGEKPSSVTNQEEDPELHPPDKSTISERSPTHAETLTSPISTPVTAAQVNPPSVDLPDSSTAHENVTPSGNIEQPQAVATQAPQLKRELVFPEENVNTLISIGYSRAEAVFALEMGEGDLARAVDYLYAPFPEE